MNLLAFDTSTETLSVAVLRAGASAPLQIEAQGGAKASTTLIPAVHALMAQAQLQWSELDAIVFGRGPGSFTGLRTACSVAQGLAFGSGVPVLGVDTLMAVAEDARERAGCERVVCVLDARMDEVYAAAYEFRAGRWHAASPITLGAPEHVAAGDGWALAGNALVIHEARLPQGHRRIESLPHAAALLRVAPALLAAGLATDAAHAMPLYIRDKVAQTTDERAAVRAARELPP
ncbi:tRNA (adenosine(37)-N6)-threonylcarbamoyltransferase complex dimerization subunit type 1 TsaB [Caenimonas koreensis]|uniref:tRNA (Adenosine(37)-N6)-threonylcarbamoyltransferase complex dimerization subunit type 1 TsaB n=1 Tax=Caenimonas koreensis DSM 17982 TaxID=1121255 RepID=A0A844BAV8_9BURK|nr:tRNA (adenosine(37)-N6)-threonylcarbamoyltransferase complex dimerization subunit type 1 TsaB [Caenimonas koreensis]MRD48709.1 tRNA (adenosine(37)-N6)-threonylcarbamoyltransferase complex dimerization subunit type 1 TsaB [Caenimonas koreensis DSM 17982]